MPHVTGELAQLEIFQSLVTGVSLVARVGATEGAAIRHFLRRSSCRSSNPSPYASSLTHELKMNSGFFPATDESIDWLSELYLRAISKIDIYAAWSRYDAAICPPGVRRIRLIDLDPFFTTHRWTFALEGRRVCFVSPFVDTMRAQYCRRADLFSAPVLPDMDAVFVRAPMTNCGVNVANQSWISNMRALEEDVIGEKPDVVVVGAGAYGLPLGVAAKAAGISAVVLGGSTQLLFGIIGNRWANDRQYRNLFNNNWVRPSEQERPAGFDGLEIQGGAYW